MIRLINYLTNDVVCHIPSFAMRRLWYRRVLGVEFGKHAGVHLGCYIWFYGSGQLRRDGLTIGANSRSTEAAVSMPAVRCESGAT